MTKHSLFCLFFFLLLGCDKPVKNHEIENPNSIVKKVPNPNIDAPPNDEVTQNTTVNEILPAADFISAEWVDLIPKDDLNALLNPPSYINDIAENSVDDKLNSPLKNTTENSEDKRYHQALNSTRVIPEINNVPIRLPAFIVPLEFDDEQKVTQFFMVPFFGACIHEPPPPPNQTIFVNYPQGFILESLTEPYWISGVLKISLIENEVATAAYTLEMHAFEPYNIEY